MLLLRTLVKMNEWFFHMNLELVKYQVFLLTWKHNMLASILTAATVNLYLRNRFV